MKDNMRDIQMYMQLHMRRLFSFGIVLLCAGIIAFSQYSLYATTDSEQYTLQRAGSNSNISLQTIPSESATVVRDKIKLNKRQQILRDSLNKLDISQYRVLVTTFSKAHAFDLHYTMTAIAWHESAFGKHPINLADPSFGVFHNLITSVMNRINIKDSEWNRSRVAERLMLDYDFSFSQALAELEYWKSYHTSKRASKIWSKTVMSYNAGYNYQNGKAYLRAIKDKVKALKSYIQDHRYIFKAILRRSY